MRQVKVLWLEQNFIIWTNGINIERKKKRECARQVKGIWRTLNTGWKNGSKDVERIKI